MAINFWLLNVNWLKYLAISQNVQIVTNTRTIKHLTMHLFCRSSSFWSDHNDSTPKLIGEYLQRSEGKYQQNGYYSRLVHCWDYIHLLQAFSDLRVLIEGQQVDRSLENPREPLEFSIQFRIRKWHHNYRALSNNYIVILWLFSTPSFCYLRLHQLSQCKSFLHAHLWRLYIFAGLP